MSAQADIGMQRTARTTAARSLAGALTAERIAVLALAVVSTILVAVTWNRWGDIWLDSGYDLVAAAKVSHADAPYLDFDYWYGPAGPLLLGAVFEVFGIGIGASVGLGLVLAAAGIAASYVLARRFAGAPVAAAVGLLVAVPALSNSNVSYVQPHTLAAPLGVLLGLVALAGAWRFATTGRRAWLPAIGLAVGLSATTRPESFGAAALGIGGWLLVRILRAPHRRASVLDLAIVVGASVATVVAAYGAFFIAGSVHHGLTLGVLLHENLFPRGLLRESVSVVLDDVAPRTPASVAGLVGKLALYGVGVAALVAVARGVAAGGTRRRLAIAVLALATVGFLGLFAVKPDTLRYYLKFAFAWLPLGAPLAVAVLGWRAVRLRERSWDATAQLELLVALMLLGSTYVAYGKYIPYPNPDFPQETAYAMPLIATFLAWLHVSVLPRTGVAAPAALRAVGSWWIGLLAVGCALLLVHDARQETFMVRGTDGTMAATAADGEVYQAAVNLIQRETRRSDPILLAPQMTSLYVMTGRRDALPQLSLLPGALEDAAAQRRAIATLEAEHLRLAIIDRRPLTRYEHGTWGVEYDRLVGGWLHRNFTHITTLRGRSAGGNEPRTLDVWLRRTL
ncbi:MAG: hypothetical protein JWQ20_1038 [Conexibacter sp.]|nr:hypothetical protein [Conexibacter sp.]